MTRQWFSRVTRLLRRSFVSAGRPATRILLGAVLVVSVGGAARAAAYRAWEAMAAPLAVVASAISALAARWVIEKQEDAQTPYPYPSFDVTSRYGLVQFVMRNLGGSPAYNIRIEWDNPLINSEGERISFSEDPDGVEIPYLMQGESLSVPVGGARDLFSSLSSFTYSGRIIFTDSQGCVERHRFHLSLARHKKQLKWTQEEPKALFELQQIPCRLSEITRELQRIREQLVPDCEQMGRGTVPRSEVSAEDPGGTGEVTDT